MTGRKDLAVPRAVTCQTISTCLCTRETIIQRVHPLIACIHVHINHLQMCNNYYKSVNAIQAVVSTSVHALHYQSNVDSMCDYDVPPHLMKLSDEDNASFIATIEELRAAEVSTL